MQFVVEQLIKSASSLSETRDIMSKIYGESPENWPYGLTGDAIDWNGLYMIREASTRKPVGFTGWQVLPEGMKKIGYYSIGILPEYRQHGYAKAAVAQLIQEKAASVDAVRAFIMPHNKPSHELARSLGVEVTDGGFGKEAKHKHYKYVGCGHTSSCRCTGPKETEEVEGNCPSCQIELSKAAKAHVRCAHCDKPFDPAWQKETAMGAVKCPHCSKTTDQEGKSLSKAAMTAPLKWEGKHLAAMLGMGTGTAAFWDKIQHPENKLPFQGDWDTNRVGNTGLNAVLGAGSVPLWRMGHPMTALEAPTLLPPGKDWLLSSLPAARKLPGLVDSVRDAADSNQFNSKLLAGAGMVGVGALGVAGLLGLRSLARGIQNQARNSAGKVRVTLPSRGPTEAETQIELPIDDVNLSRTMHHALSRDTRRRLREETMQRTWQRDPKTHHLVTKAEDGESQVLHDIASEKIANYPVRTDMAAKIAELQELLS